MSHYCDMSAYLTKSEERFEAFFVPYGLRLNRVTGSKERRPDYRLTLVDTDVIAEMKEFEPTSEERTLIECDPEQFDSRFRSD